MLFTWNNGENFEYSLKNVQYFRSKTFTITVQWLSFLKHRCTCKWSLCDRYLIAQHLGKWSYCIRTMLSSFSSNSWFLTGNSYEYKRTCRLLPLIPEASHYITKEKKRNSHRTITIICSFMSPRHNNSTCTSKFTKRIPIQLVFVKVCHFLWLRNSI